MRARLRARSRARAQPRARPARGRYTAVRTLAGSREHRATDTVREFGTKDGLQKEVLVARRHRHWLEKYMCCTRAASDVRYTQTAGTDEWFRTSQQHFSSHSDKRLYTRWEHYA